MFEKNSFKCNIIVALTVLLLFVSFNLWAAITGKIAGQVIDKRTGDPLPGANVVIEGTQMGAATDVDGYYFIINVPPGTYSVQVSMMGYTTITKTDVRIKIEQTTTVDFALEEQAIAGQEITVVSERPVVELDLTASKEVMSGDEIAQTWVNTVEEAMVVQSGVNVHGGVRGGFGLDTPLNIDGQQIRDGGSNRSFTTVSTTAIQELEVLTGGFNAEYGQANAGVVRFVTKNPTQKYHGVIKYRYRPSGLYHWGGNLYGKDRWERRQYDWAGNPAPGNPDFWDPSKGGKEPSAEPFASMTPEERVQAWQEIISEFDVLTGYADRAQWESDFTFTGPVPFVDKLGFMLSGRWLEGVLEYPSALKYHPQWNINGKLTYSITDNTKLIANITHYGARNSGAYIYPYTGSSEAGGFGATNPTAYFTSPYNAGKYWPFGNYGFGGGTGLGRVKPPEKVKGWTGFLKATHVFSPATYVEFMYTHTQHFRNADFLDVAKNFYIYRDKTYGYTYQGETYPLTGSAMDNGFFVNWAEPGDRMWSTHEYREHTFRLDFTSQFNRFNQLKAGALFSFQYFYDEIGNSNTGDGATGLTRYGLQGDLVGPLPYSSPWEAAVYAQDKIEVKGMVINVGLRLDMFNGMKKTAPSIWDPLGLSAYTETHPEDVDVGIMTFDRDSEFAEDTPTKWAISPRIGIAHPITESTVLHFMYGHFNQRPGWTKIVANGPTSWSDKNLEYSTPPWFYFDPTNITQQYSQNVRIWTNPWLGYEKNIQYEIGFDQNLFDKVRLDVTLFYADKKGLTTLGTRVGGRDDASGYGTSSNSTTNLRGLPDENKIRDHLSVPINGGTSESRGLELSARSLFMRNVNLYLSYNMSYAVSDKYGPNTLFIELEDGTKRGDDTWLGGNNGDQGTSGNSNERWNPNHTIRLNAVVQSPKEFGPALGQFYPLGDWTINWFTHWNSGQLYTWHAPGDFSPETNNKRWEGKMFTNLRLARLVEFLGLRSTLSMDVINLFNQKQLKRLGGTTLDQYELEGILPFHTTTGEELEWEWYEADLLPRKIYFGIEVEF